MQSGLQLSKFEFNVIHLPNEKAIIDEALDSNTLESLRAYQDWASQFEVKHRSIPFHNCTIKKQVLMFHSPNSN
jgi:hypothetical protein